MKNNYLKKLCVASVLSALFVAFELLAANIGKIVFLDNYQIPISCFPLILASVMLGPLWGTAVGVVGAFLSQLFFGISWATVVWMMPTVCYSFAVAIMFVLFKKSYKTYILAIEFVISSLLLSTLNLIARYVDINILLNNYMTFGKNELTDSLLAVFISLKFVGAVVFAIVFAIIVPPIVKKLKKVIRF